ncbi:MAG: hypothetical protein IJ678_04280, partial [Kiritimatiellae bacterium]|nr:hypothetical protein [Kiritimatiellia bacterium]
AAAEAREQLAAIRAEGFAVPQSGPSAAREAAEALRTESLCLASVAYLEACLAEVQAGVGSRGSSIVLDESGAAIPENPSFRAFVQETELVPECDACETVFTNRFSPCRPIPTPDNWFENVWRDYREGRVFAQSPAASHP